MARRNSILVNRSLYQIGIITFVASIMWVGIGIYLTVTKSSSVDVDKSLLEPINANINQDVVDSLSKRLKIEEILGSSPEGSISAVLQDSAIINESQTQ